MHLSSHKKSIVRALQDHFSTFAKSVLDQVDDPLDHRVPFLPIFQDLGLSFSTTCQVDPLHSAPRSTKWAQDSAGMDLQPESFVQPQLDVRASGGHSCRGSQWVRTQAIPRKRPSKSK